MKFNSYPLGHATFKEILLSGDSQLPKLNPSKAFQSQQPTTKDYSRTTAAATATTTTTWKATATAKATATTRRETRTRTTAAATTTATTTKTKATAAGTRRRQTRTNKTTNKKNNNNNNNNNSDSTNMQEKLWFVQNRGYIHWIKTSCHPFKALPASPQAEVFIQNLRSLATNERRAGRSRWPTCKWRFEWMENVFNGEIHVNTAMDQYLLIPFLGGWTSIYQLFWCSPGVQGFDTLPYMHRWIMMDRKNYGISSLPCLIPGGHACSGDPSLKLFGSTIFTSSDRSRMKSSGNVPRENVCLGLSVCLWGLLAGFPVTLSEICPWRPGFGPKK